MSIPSILLMSFIPLTSFKYFSTTVPTIGLLSLANCSAYLLVLPFSIYALLLKLYSFLLSNVLTKFLSSLENLIYWDLPNMPDAYLSASGNPIPVFFWTKLNKSPDSPASKSCQNPLLSPATLIARLPLLPYRHWTDEDNLSLGLPNNCSTTDSAESLSAFLTFSTS